jgi:hypothetical protein
LFLLLSFLTSYIIFDLIRYTLWRKNVRNKKMSKAMNSLRNSLFILHPKISVALLKIREISYAMGGLRLCLFRDGTTYSLDEFISEQGSGMEFSPATSHTSFFNTFISLQETNDFWRNLTAYTNKYAILHCRPATTRFDWRGWA